MYYDWRLSLNCNAFSAFSTAAINDSSAIMGCHAFAESVLSVSLLFAFSEIGN